MGRKSSASGVCEIPARYLTFLWHAQQPAALSLAAIQALDDPAAELFVSDVSLWEITLKHSSGKLPLPAAPRTWIPEKLGWHQLQPLPVTHEVLFRSGELPGVHTVPFDRLLAAQAIKSGMVLVSPDVPLSLLGAARVW